MKKLSVELKRVDSDLIKSEVKVAKVKGDYQSIKEQVDKLEVQKSSYDSKNGLLDGFLNELKVIKQELDELKVPGELKLDSLQEKRIDLISTVNTNESLIKELNNEIKEFSKLKGKCPMCKQEVSEEHSHGVKEGLCNKVMGLETENNELKNKLLLINEGVKAEEVKKRTIELINSKRERASELNERISWLKGELKKLEPSVSELIKIKGLFSKINDQYLRLSNEYSVLIEKKNNLEFSVKRVTNELSINQKELKNLEQNKTKVVTLEGKVKLLSRLRDDIRNIRSVVRTQFLEDFRHEFQSKYEDIRRDDGYSVEINNNYEPLAFAGKEETSINSLSGGEKTSVALAYRLALSEIAARVSSINHNELLLLDEPTTGFDRRDLNVLPEALRSIKTIPQIIIVSHEDELKEAADVNYELVKKNGTTSLIE